MRWTRWTFLLLMVAPGGATRSMLDGDTIMRRSTAANRADWIAAPDYAYMERTHNDDRTKTYDVTMILGSFVQTTRKGRRHTALCCRTGKRGTEAQSRGR